MKRGKIAVAILALSIAGMPFAHSAEPTKLTAEQKAVLAEHAQNERDAELEAIRAEERADLRANAPAFLFKESYSE